jgi:phosphatidylserine/phosphatidylglycerophosphate/cardiolipin synthase-like enzyme
MANQTLIARSGTTMIVNLLKALAAVVLTIALGGCATMETIAPKDCPAGTQALENCPPAHAIQDAEIEKIYVERAWEFAGKLEGNPILLARDAEIPINDGLVKFIDSTDEGAINAIASKIWMIEQAEHTIDVIYYIFSDDLIGHAILGALCDAVKRGVDVRMMIDSIGSSVLDRDNLRALRSCGLYAGFMRDAKGRTTVYKARVQPVIFNSATKLFSNLNRRSHDKLILVDGRFPGKSYAITGGRNISLDYYGFLEDGSPNTHSYRDAEILVHGPAGTDEEYPIGYVSETYYSLLFLFDQNKHLTMRSIRNPAQAYQKRRDGFRDALAKLKALPLVHEQLDKMPAYMTSGFHDADVLLAHELQNVIAKNVVTKAVENLGQAPNSIVHILNQLGEEGHKRVQIVSPYLFAARYKDGDGNVVVDDAKEMLEWLDKHPDSTITIVTNSVLTSDNFLTQAVIDVDLAPRLLLSEEFRERWGDSPKTGELDTDLVGSEEWRAMVNHPRLAIYETGRMDDVLFGGQIHHRKLHAKYVIGDDVGHVGTSNFDYRSRLYNSEMGYFFRSEALAEDIAKNTDYLISLSYRWGSPEWLEMRRRMRDMGGFKASTVRDQRDIYKTLKNTGLIWLF